MNSKGNILSEVKTPFRSDNLRQFYGIRNKHPRLVDLLGMPRQIHVVIDTNVVLQELLFVTRSRKKLFARTSLREVLDCSLVSTIAPFKLRDEVNRHIPRLARQEGIPEEKLRLAWLELEAQIEFRDVRQNTLLIKNIADPDDVPFVCLYLMSGADAVLTADKDISQMGARTLDPNAIKLLRDYARTKSPEVSLRIGGILIAGVAVGSIVAVLKVLVAALRRFSQLSPEAQLILIAGAVFAALHPTSRRVLTRSLSAIAARVKGSGELFGEVLADVSVKYAAAHSDVMAKQSVITELLPNWSSSMGRATLPATDMDLEPSRVATVSFFMQPSAIASRRQRRRRRKRITPRADELGSLGN